MLGESIELVGTASPAGILAIFLPILIFTSGFRTEWHIFKKLSGQSLIMGILCTIVSACIIMFFVKMILDSENVLFYILVRNFIVGIKLL